MHKFRYSELKDFHKKIKDEIKAFYLDIELPHYPKRKLFGSTNKNVKDIIDR